MGAIMVADAVVELGDAARAAGQQVNQLAEAAKAAALFGHGHGQQGLALFAHIGALGDKAQAVKIHVRTAQNRGVGFALGLVLGHVLLDGGHRQGPGGFNDGAGVHKDVFDGRAHRIGIDHHKIIDQVLRNAEGLLPYQLHRRAVREQAHIGQLHPLTGQHRLAHGIRIFGLHANDFDVRPHRLDVIGHARN